MLTKGALGNLVNRYRAVLRKCHLINVFGSLAVASMLVLGGAGEAMAFGIISEYQGKSSVQDNTQPNYESGVVGGWFNALTDVKEVKVTFENVTGNVIVGGNFGKQEKNGWTSELPEQNIPDGISGLSTDNIIKGDNTKTYAVIGGNHIVYGDTTVTKALTFKGHTTSLTIEGGTFGEGKPDPSEKAACPSAYIIAGDLLKPGGGDRKHIVDEVAKSILDKASLTINGGTFHAPVFGGSGALEYYNGNAAGVEVQVKETETRILGGTFKQPIYAGGFATGVNHNTQTPTPTAISTVDIANLTIDGSNGALKEVGDVYAGGLKNKKTQKESTATVDSATITVKDTTVVNIYGSGGTYVGIGANGQEQANDSVVVSYKYEPLKEVLVNTKLTLTNVTASGEVYVPKGQVTLIASGKNGKTTISEMLTVEKAANLSMKADGAVNDAVNGDIAQLKDKYISINKAYDYTAKQEYDPFATPETKVTLAPGTIIGEVTGYFNADGTVTSTEKPNETNVAMADLPLINHMLTRVEMNDLRKRMGDIRLLEGETGTWARWEGGRLKGDNGLTNDFHKIQLGADTTTGIESLRLGASFSYTNGEMDFAKAGAESDTLSFAGYGVWTADNGMFADVIARLAFIDTEIQTDKVKGELDNLAFSLSGEYGWRFDLCDQFFVEPQVELTYTYINSDDFISAGAKFDFDSSDSLVGRAGLTAGWKLPNDRGDLYARASVVQEFMGDGKLTASMGNTIRRYETDGDDTWFEYGIGANIKLTDKTYIWADVERTEGAEIDEEWRGTVGIRYSF